MTTVAKSPNPAETKTGPFDKDVLMCGTCGENEATHQITISARKGLEYDSRKQLFHVDYSVCGPCARELVEVQLSAKLATTKKR